MMAMSRHWLYTLDRISWLKFPLIYSLGVGAAGHTLVAFNGDLQGALFCIIFEKFTVLSRGLSRSPLLFE
jgi:hypothetical protein